MRYSCLASRPYHWNCPGRLMMRSSSVVNRHHSRRGSRASPSRRSGRAPRALPWRSSPARSRASPLVDATLRVSPPGGVLQLRGRPETRGGCRSARTGTSLSSTSHPISKRPRLFSPPLRVQLVELEQATTRLHYSGMLQVEWQAHRQCIRVSAYVLRILEACRELNYLGKPSSTAYSACQEASGAW